MPWLNRYKNVWRVVLLILLPVAILGPWGYSSDGVPPAAWCHDPFILLENGRCVELVSGVTALTFIPSAFLSMSAGLVTGAPILPDRAGEFLGVCLAMMLLFLLVLPFFSTLLLIWRADSLRLRVLHLMAWGLAAMVGLMQAVSELVLPPTRFWGIWLYVGLAAVALILEVLILAQSKSP